MQKTLTDLSVIQKMSQQQQVWSTLDCIKKAKSMLSSLGVMSYSVYLQKEYSGRPDVPVFK